MRKLTPTIVLAVIVVAIGVGIYFMETIPDSEKPWQMKSCGYGANYVKVIDKNDTQALQDAINHVGEKECFEWVLTKTITDVPMSGKLTLIFSHN